MRYLKILFTLLAVVLALFSGFVCVYAMNTPPALLASVPAAEALTEQFMDTAQKGELSDLEPLLWGSPSLSGGENADFLLTGLLWDAFRSSLTYEFAGPCYAGSEGLCRDVTVTALDIAAVTALVEAELPAALADRVAAADPSEVYDQGSDYREDFVLDTLEQVCRDVLTRPECLSTRTVTLVLYPKDGTWWVLPTEDLLSLLTGKGG